jgi:hypothetical protein
MTPLDRNHEKLRLWVAKQQTRTSLDLVELLAIEREFERLMVEETARQHPGKSVWYPDRGAAICGFIPFAPVGSVDVYPPSPSLCRSAA